MTAAPATTRPRRDAARAASTKPRPVLLLIVYGVFLVIVGVTATAQVVIASAHFSTGTLNHTVGTDASLVGGFVNEHLLPEDLTGRPSAAHARELQAHLRDFISRRGILRVEVRAPDGRLVASDAGVVDQARQPASADWTTALAGSVAVAIVEAASSEAGPGDLGSPSLLREYFPLLREGRTVGVVGVWRDGTPITEALSGVRRDVVIVTMTAALAAALVLFLVFRSAQRRISRQTVDLLEATRRDPLTGLLNHGALVESVGATIERLRTAGGGLGIAVLDIDNFRNLNDTWGHDAGDEAILTVAERLVRHIPEGALVGRYGPDEFLIAVEGRAIGQLGTDLEWLRAALADVDLRFGDSERLPVTISAAVAAYPDHGARSPSS